MIHIPKGLPAANPDDYAKIIRHMTDAVVCVDLSGMILDWNKAAESLLGYASNDVINQHLSLIYPRPFHYQIPIILERIAKGLRLSNANAEVVHQNGGMMGVNLSFSPIIEENGQAQRFCLIMRRREEGKDIHLLLEDPAQEGVGDPDIENESKRRTFDTLRLTILACLGSQQMTINQLASYSGINWKTVENHLTYLLGKGLVREVFKSNYVRIFETTPAGREYLIRAKAQAPLQAQEAKTPTRYPGTEEDLP